MFARRRTGALPVLILVVVLGAILPCRCQTPGCWPHDGRARQFLRAVFTSQSQAEYQSRFSDNSRFRRGVSTGCGQTIQGDSGYFRSPRFPSSYRPNLMCEWKLQVPAGKKLLIRFIVFDVRGGAMGRCTESEDYLMIRDDTNSGRHLGIFCSPSSGSRKPPPVVSITNKVFVTFQSNKRHTGRGFLISFISVKDLDPADYVADQLTFKPFVQPTDMTTPTINQQKSENTGSTMSSRGGFKFLTAQRNSDLTTIALPFESIAFGNPSRGPVLYVTQEGSTEVTKTYAPPIFTEARLQTVAGISLPNPIVGKQTSGFSQPVTLKPDPDTPREHSKSKSQATEFSTESPSFTPRDSSTLPNSTPGDTFTLSVTSTKTPLELTIQREFVPTPKQSKLNSYKASPIPTKDQQLSLRTPLITTQTRGGEVTKASKPWEFSINLDHLSGELQSPNYPDAYPMGILSHWNVNVGPRGVIALNFTDFDLDSAQTGDSPCDEQYAYVKVEDGSGQDINIFCGHRIPPLVISSSNTMNITFVSRYGYGRGFHAHYTMLKRRNLASVPVSIVPACGGSFYQPSGRIQSPNVPDGSDIGVNCHWNIAADIGQVIVIKFTTFDLDSIPTDNRCNEEYDHLKIEEGFRGNSFTFCGQELPPVFVSSSNTIGITFVSAFGYSSFSALYSISENVLSQQPTTTKPLHKCGGNLYISSGVIQSPLLPQDAAMDITCQWNIIASADQIIHLIFYEFNMDSSVEDGQCDERYSHVKVDGASRTVIGQKLVFCGTEIPPSVVSSSNTLTVKFISAYGYGIRFRAEYVMEKVEDRAAIPEMSTSEPLCGGSFHQPSGMIQSPNVPDGSEIGVSCYWNITVDLGQIIVIKFTAFDLDSIPIDDWCNEEYDHLKIEDGFGGNSYTYCGQELPPVFVSSSNTIGITFVSKFGYSGGFSGFYSASEDVLSQTTAHEILAQPTTTKPLQQCGENLNTPWGVIQSPLLSEDVSMGIKCQWIITASVGQIIVLTFTEFIMDSSVENGRCDERYSHVEVEGASSTGISQKLVFCGTEIPPSVVSLSNTLAVTFISAYGYEIRFRAEYVMEKVEDRVAIPEMSTAEPLCGGSFHQPSGRIQSPNVPDGSEIGVSCYWNITVDLGQVIVIKFTAFDLDSIPIDDWCIEEYDHLKIQDGFGGNSYTYCGQELPPMFVSSSNTIGITFVSKFGYSGGFIAIFSADEVLSQTSAYDIFLQPSSTEPLQQCEENLNTPWGVIQSPLLSDDVFMGFKCQWNITAPVGQIIVLTFTEFIMDSSVENGRCDERYSHVEVEGASSSGISQKLVFCGTEIPPSVVSSSNTLAVTFISGYGYELRFRAEYVMEKVKDRVAIPEMSTAEPLCGGSFHQPSGRIQSPNVPDGSEIGVSCYWNITVDLGQVIFIKFTAFDLDSIPIDDWCNEEYDHLKIEDGFGGNSYTYCGQELPPVFVSSSNTIGITFVSKLGYSGGFSGFYSASEDVLSQTTAHEVLAQPTTTKPLQQCGENLNTPWGVIQSPLLSEDVSMGIKCQWIITAPVGQIIVLTFTEFIMDSSVENGRCDERYSHVEVEGASSTGISQKLLFCGTEIPPSVVSSSNTLAVTFISGHGYEIRFRAEYVMEKVEDRAAIPEMSTAEPLCGGSFHQPSGRIQSPNVPDGSEIGVSCYWNITVDLGQVIVIKFTAFDLDSIPIDDWCIEEYDHLKIENGFGGNSYTYCGQELPPVFVSSSNTIGITFVSKFGYSGGFSAFYSASEDVLSQTTAHEVLAQPTTTKPLQQCGENLNTPWGVIQSPLLSEDVSMGIKCQWIITAPVGQIIVLTFTEFIMDSSVENGRCDERYSHVEVEGASSTGISQKLLFCGTEIPPSVVSSSNTLAVTFISGYGYEIRFRAEYVMEKVEDRVAIPEMSTSEPLCGGSFHQPSGRIQSPNVPDGSEIGVSCYWNITVDLGQVIVIKFTAFDLDSIPIDDWCIEEYDHLKIQDGFGGNSYTYCGQELPPVFVSSSNTIGITFVSKFGYSGGFSAFYSASEDVLSQTTAHEVLAQPSTTSLQQCGENLNTPWGVIQSPLLSEDVLMGIKCQWIITAPVGQIIVLTFTEFIMDSSVENGRCDERYSHVEVEGASSTGISQKLLFCGTEIPPSVVSSSNTLAVTFISGYGYEIRFRAEYVMEKVEDRAAIPEMSTAEPLCGGSFHQPSGRIQSPNVPDGSEIGVSCYWNITVDLGQVIVIKFTAFDLDSIPIDDWCIEEYDHLKIENGFGGNSYTYCGQELPPVFVSSSNTIGITFVSKLGYSGGFSGFYSASEDVLSQTTAHEVLAQPTTTKPLQQCGENLNTPWGVIQSPLLSEDVSMGIKCQWIITAPVGQIIVLTFTEFIMDSSVENGRCDERYSHVEVEGASSTGISQKLVFCGTEIPPSVVSSSNTLAVTFISGYGYEIRFRAEYVMEKVEDRAAIPEMSTAEPLCGGSFHQPSGRIQSPNVPDGSEIGVSCYWNITVDLGQVIVIKFTAFDLDSIPIDDWCIEEYDHLKIENGFGGNSYTYCGQELPPVFASSSNTIGITFVSKFGYSGGFSAFYSASEDVLSQTTAHEVLAQPTTTKPLQQCGENLNTPWGVIQSPLLSEDVSMGIKCQWIITAPVGQIIVLTFTEFIMDSSVENGRCDERYSHVEVEGASSTGISQKLLFCGTKIPPSVVSSSNTLAVTFISSYGYEIRFRAEYVMEKVEDRVAIPEMSTAEQLCGGSFHQPSGRIQSPNVPDGSEIGVSCYWNITVDLGQVIVIKFTAFDLDSIPIDDWCNEEYDHLKIEDGFGGNSYTYCGQELPPVFVSSSNTIGITFVSKFGYSGGFSAFYSASEDVLSQTTAHEVLAQPTTTKPLQQCGENLNTPWGVIQSPLLSEDVSMGIKCQWIITAPVGQIIVLTFTEFIMDSSVENGRCDERYSHVEVEGASSTGISQKLVFCGTEIPPSVVSLSNTLAVTFISGYGYEIRFRAEYVMEKVEDRVAIPEMSTAEPLCGGSFHQPSGRIQSPNVPDGSEIGVSCYWNITVDLGQVIVIKFTAFDLDSIPIDDWCNEEYDHLKIEDGFGGNSYTYCGQELPPVFVSSSNTIGITFVSKLGYSGGFSAFYSASEDVLSQTTAHEVLAQPSTTSLQQCGENLNTPWGVIQSPLLSEDVSMGIKCQWIITAPVGQIIVLTFTEFIMDSSVENGRCDERYSHVEVEGASSTGISQKLVFCGTEIPPSVVSSWNTLAVTFISGYGYEIRFRAEYVMEKVEDRVAIPEMSTAEPLCGGSFHQPSGRIQSPNVPDGSEIGVSCYWNITVDLGQVIVIKFTAFDLDSIPIDDWCNEEYDHLKIEDGFGGNSYTYCGQELPPVFVSSSNTIGITFVSKFGYSGGFSAFYSASEDVLSQTTAHEVLAQPTTTKPLQQCGENLNTPWGVIQSPLLSEDVSMGIKCQWIITAPVGQIIVLTFTEFIMDSSVENGRCDERYSHVEVEGASSTGISQKLVFCGTEIPPSVVSLSNTLAVTFISGYGYEIRFRAEYVMEKVEDRVAIPEMSTAEPLCGGSFHQPSGRIQSPNVPDGSEIGVSCYWNITVDLGQVIVIKFTAFDLDSIPIDDWCNEEYDHLKIEDGFGGNSYTYCGQELPPVFVSSSNTIGITFVSKLGYSGGFSAFYSASEDVLSQTTAHEVLAQPSTTSLQQCGENLNTPWGVIQSPLLSEDVSMGIKCQWIITAPVGQIIVLTFTEFIMDSSVENGRCDERYSHVEVEGASSTGISQKLVFCGTEIPPSVVSSWNTLAVTFISGYGYEIRFRAEYVMEKVEDRVAIPEMSTAEPLCGGSFHQPSGRIQSPNVPDGSEIGVSCYWNITVDLGQVIVIKFTAFDLDSIPIDDWCNEEYDHLKIEDGFGGNSYTYCGQELPPVFVSSSNTIGITFVSKFGYSGGFSGFYSASEDVLSQTTAHEVLAQPSTTSLQQCGENLNTPWGVIQSPLLSEDVSMGIKCQWIITAPVGQIIVLTFTEFIMDSSVENGRCDERYSHVEVEGASSTGISQKLVFCGTEIPPSVVSSWNTLAVTFISGYGYEIRFRAEYVMEKVEDRVAIPEMSTAEPLCGGSFHQPSGRIQSPNVPDGSEIGVSCYWNITVDLGQVIVIKFTAFDLDSIPIDDWCNEEYDHLKIEDGFGGNSYTYCGQELPPVFVSSSNTIGITFVSKFGYSGGFSGFYSASEDVLSQTTAHEVLAQPSTTSLQQCGENLNTPWGVIQSPLLSEDVSMGIKCQWIITAPVGQIIVLTFTEFIMDSSVKNGRCDERYSHVEVEGASSTGISQKLVFCGTEIPPSVVSSSNTLAVTFISGYGYEIRFRAEYVMEKVEDRAAIPEMSTAEPLCGGSFHQPSGRIQSPNVPDGSEIGVSCYWNITVDLEQVIVIKFTAFDLDSIPIDDWCNEEYDHLKIEDGFGGNSYTYCGQELPPVFVSSSNTIGITFVSKFGYSGGFSAHYSVTDKVVGFQTASPKVFIPPSASEPSFQCGGILNNPQGEILSPQFPDDLETKASCQWNITVAIGRIIVFNFTEFDLDSIPIDDRCNEDYAHVKILDQDSSYVYCGQEKPPTYVSSKNTILVLFESARGYSGGFRAYYSETQRVDSRGFTEPQLQTTPHQSQPLETTQLSHSCGANLNEPSGIIHYYTGDLFYVHCRWNITVDAGWVIVLNFTIFELDSTPIDGQCDERYAYIKLVDTEALEYIFCGWKKPPGIVSDTRTLIVEFFSYFGIGHRFLATYAAIKRDSELLPPRVITATPLKSTTEILAFPCGGSLSAPMQEIHSPDITRQPLEKTVSCKWEITVTDELIIVLTFTAFDLDSIPVNGNLCDERYDYVGITDGEPGAPVQLFCGQSIPDVFVSSTNTLIIVFITHFGYGRGFSAYYTSMKSESRFIATMSHSTVVSALAGTVSTPLQPAFSYQCGGNLHKPNGVIQSPNVPEDYVSIVTCTWNITVAPHSTIVLTFLTFELDSVPVDDQCDLRYPHTSVTDGRSEAGGVKHIYCGQDLPGVFYSSFNTVIVEFVSYYGLGGEFYISYTSSQAETSDYKLLPASTSASEELKSRPSMVTDKSSYPCGGTLDFPSGVIQFPGIVSAVQGQAILCRWTIRAQVGWVITLNFTFFNLDSVSVDNQCDEQYAHVKVIDGEDAIFPIQVFCGKDLPSFVTSTNVLVIIFNDLQGYSEGFQAQYSTSLFATTTILPTLPRLLIPATPKDIYPTVCRSILMEDSGIFSSPQYPYIYPANIFCSWIITTSDNTRFVALKFLDFNVDNSMLEPECSSHYSYVRVSYHSVSGIEETRLLCGNSQPKTIAPGSHQLTVEFFSNMGIGHGFQAAYQVYDPSEDVSEIDWSHFIEGHDDILTTPQSLSTKKDGVYMYTELMAPTGIITSPHYPAEFPQDSYVVWVVKTSQEKLISLIFEDIDFGVPTDDDSHCSTLYTHLKLTIYSSEDRASNIIICQNASREDVISHGELKLEFRSSFGEGRGFKARYLSGIQSGGEGEESLSKTTPVSSPSATNEKALTISAATSGRDESSCDKLLTEPDGIISSPNFPLSMPQGTECTWVIQIPGSHEIYLEFLDFALDEEVEIHQGTCRQESASVSVAMNGMLYEFCGNVNPAPMTTSDNMVVLVFRSNSAKGAGFRMHYIGTSLISTSSGASSAHTTSHFGVRVMDDFTDTPGDGRDLTSPTRERVNVPVSPPREPSTIAASPGPDLNIDVARTTELVQTMSKMSFSLPEYTAQPKETGMASTDSGAIDIISDHRLRITTYVCISVAIVLFIILVILTGVCIYKRHHHHITKSIVLGQTEKSYWQNYKSWAVDYTGGPGRSSRAATTRDTDDDDDDDDADDMLKQERLV